MRIRFIGNVTVKGVSYKDGDEDDIHPTHAADAIALGVGVLVEESPVQVEEPVVEALELPIPLFKRRSKR